MNHSKDRADVDAAMQRHPTFAAKATNPPRSRSYRERNQEHKGGEAESNEWTFNDIFQHARKIEGLIGAKIGKKVETDVKEREEAKHAAEADEFRQTKKFSEWRDAEREDEEAKSPVAGLMLEKFDGICSQVIVEATPD